MFSLFGSHYFFKKLQKFFTENPNKSPSGLMCVKQVNANYRKHDHPDCHDHG